MIENVFRTLTDYVIHLYMIMKLRIITLAPHETRMCPIDFGVKRSRS